MSRYKFTYSHEDYGTFVVDEPGGFDSAILGFSRLPLDQGGSLVEFYRSNFSAYGDNGTENGGREIFKLIEKTYGPDTQIDILVEVNEGDGWEDVFSGTLPIGLFTEALDQDLILDQQFGQKGFWTNFINRLETPVDLRSPEDLDGNAVEVIEPVGYIFPDQRIIKSAYYSQYDFDDELKEPWGYTFTATDLYATLDLPRIDLEEIQTKHNYPSGDASDIDPTDTANNQLSLELINSDGPGDAEFDIQIVLASQENAVGSTFPVDGSILIKLQVDNGPVHDFARDTRGTIAVDERCVFTYAGTESVNKGSKIKIFIESTLTSLIGDLTLYVVNNDRRPGENSFISVKLNSKYTVTSSRAFLTFDYFRQIIRRICPSDLQSNYLGGEHTSVVYPENGCGYPYINLPGLWVRGYQPEDKPYFQSFKDGWTGLFPMHGVGYGYTEEGKIEIEKLQDFFDSSAMSTIFYNVQKIKRVYNQDQFFNSVEIGSAKWESEYVSGIDDPQTKRTYASRLKTIGKAISLLSTWISASLTFEVTRRQGALKSSDYKYDNDTFVVAINDDLTIQTDEGFIGVNNLQNEALRYNKKLTPARSMLRLLDYLSLGLYAYLDSFFKFTKGEGNFDMESRMAETDCPESYNGDHLDEDGDIQVSQTPIFCPQGFEIETECEWEQYKAIKANRKMAIGISQTDQDEKPFFIADFQYNKTEGQVKMIVWPKEYFEIQRPEN